VEANIASENKKKNFYYIINKCNKSWTMIVMNTTYRLIRLLSLPKLGEIGPVKSYHERFLLNIKTQ